MWKTSAYILKSRQGETDEVNRNKIIRNKVIRNKVIIRNKDRKNSAPAMISVTPRSRRGKPRRRRICVTTTSSVVRPGKWRGKWLQCSFCPLIKDFQPCFFIVVLKWLFRKAANHSKIRTLGHVDALSPWQATTFCWSNQCLVFLAFWNWYTISYLWLLQVGVMKCIIVIWNFVI